MASYVELVTWAAVATVEEAGLLPDDIEDMPTYMRGWFSLMRRHDRRLCPLTDKELGSLLFPEEGDAP
jgi:hypothetical protein